MKSYIIHNLISKIKYINKYRKLTNNIDNIYNNWQIKIHLLMTFIIKIKFNQLLINLFSIFWFMFKILNLDNFPKSRNLQINMSMHSYNNQTQIQWTNQRII